MTPIFDGYGPLTAGAPTAEPSAPPAGAVAWAAAVKVKAAAAASVRMALRVVDAFMMLMSNSLTLAENLSGRLSL